MAKDKTIANVTAENVEDGIRIHITTDDGEDHTYTIIKGEKSPCIGCDAFIGMCYCNCVLIGW